MTDHPLSDGTSATSWALNPWQPMTSAIGLKHLGKLIEELKRGWEDELADVLANIELVMAHFKLDAERMEARKQRKITHLRGWHSMLEDADPGETR
jgi:hypothetical protein